MAKSPISTLVPELANYERANRELEAFMKLVGRTTFFKRQWQEIDDKGKPKGPEFWAVAADQLDHSGRLENEAEADALVAELNSIGEFYRNELRKRLNAILIQVSA